MMDTKEIEKYFAYFTEEQLQVAYQNILNIRDSIEETSSVQNQLLIEQNNLLRGILAKNTDIVLDGEKVTKKVNKINARKGYRMAT